MSFFSKSVHTGKPVITFQDPNATLKVLRPVVRASFDPNAAYLLVGCLGGLGRSLVTWMVERGARRLFFFSRSGTDKPEAASIVRDLAEVGAKPQVVRCDVTDEKALVLAMEQITSQLPVKGVIHAAMVEGDSFFDSTSLSRIRSVLAPKVTSTVNLHKVTTHLPLDFFLMTSSIVGTVGTPTQLYCTYGVSETEFLQLLEGALCESTVSGHGSVLSKLDPRSSAQLVTGLEPAHFIPYLATGRANDLVWFKNTRFQAVTRAISKRARARNSAANNASGAPSSLGSRLQETSSPEEKLAIAREAISSRIGELMSLAANDLDVGKPISHYGLDSLVAGELRNWLVKSVGVEVPLLMLLDQGTKIEDLVKKAAGLDSKA